MKSGTLSSSLHAVFQTLSSDTAVGIDAWPQQANAQKRCACCCLLGATSKKLAQE
jgi:hypothetical protein